MRGLNFVRPPASAAGPSPNARRRSSAPWLTEQEVLVLKDAIGKGASDIHVEPYEKDFRVRFRIDGVMYEVMRPPMKLKNPSPLVSV